jgi:hypothetical protein
LHHNNLYAVTPDQDLKITQANTDGLINWLPASPAYTRQIHYIMTKASRDTVGSPDKSVLHYKVYERELSATYRILWHLDSSCYRDKVNRAAGQRAGALFFARHLDYFIFTQNSHPLPGLGTV